MKTDNIMDFTKEEAAILINHIAARTIKSLHQQGLLKKPSAVQQATSSEAFKSLLKKLDAPKYDPCRLFRDGDKVTPRLVNGRDFNSMAEEYRGKILTVTRDEEKYDNVFVEYGGDAFTIDPAYLELITPVEELEPYCIADHIHGWLVYKDTPGNVVANFNKTHPHAKQAAEAECARLNAEHRKEMS